MARRNFTYQEALATFPVVRDLTATAVRQIEALFNLLTSREEMDARREELQAAYEHIVAAWAEEVQAVGCEVKGPWLVDWNAGPGAYSWRYPEETLAHYQEADAELDQRLPIN